MPIWGGSNDGIGKYRWKESISEGIENYIKNKESADLTVVYGDKKYRFHEFLLCSQSSFFSKALRNFKEAKTKELVLQHGKPEILDAMFAFLTTGDYQVEQATATEGPKLSKKQKKKLKQRIKNEAAVGNVVVEPVEKVEEGKPSPDATAKTLFHIDVYAIADFYDIPLLKELAIVKFTTLSKSETFCEEGFPEIVERVYESTLQSDRGLRDILMDRVVTELSEVALRQDEARANNDNSNPKSLVFQVALQTPQFGQDVFLESARGYRVCPECKIKKTADKVPLHGESPLVCRTCCAEARDQEYRTAVAAANTNAQNNGFVAVHVPRPSCNFCPGEYDNNGWGAN